MRHLIAIFLFFCLCSSFVAVSLPFKSSGSQPFFRLKKIKKWHLLQDGSSSGQQSLVLTSLDCFNFNNQRDQTEERLMSYIIKQTILLSRIFFPACLNNLFVMKGFLRTKCWQLWWEVQKYWLWTTSLKQIKRWLSVVSSQWNSKSDQEWIILGPLFKRALHRVSISLQEILSQGLNNTQK